MKYTCQWYYKPVAPFWRNPVSLKSM